MYKLLSVKNSPNKKYKLQVELYNTETKRIKRISFGANGMMDFILYTKQEGKEIANKRKKLYLIRHQKNEDWTKRGIETKGFWSRWLLWSRDTLDKSIKFILKKFNLN
jgi:hypothetical protein